MVASRQQGRCLGAYECLFLAVTHQLVDAMPIATPYNLESFFVLLPWNESFPLCPCILPLPSFHLIY